MAETGRTKLRLIDGEWVNTTEGMNYVKQMYNQTTMKRKLFGILEHPSLMPGIQQVNFKVFLAGKASVGKTYAIARLADQVDVNSVMNHSETLGIRATDVYWPVRLPDKIVVCKFQFWDAGESSSKKYSHILPACQENLDGILATFSFNDKQTFLDAAAEFRSHEMSSAVDKPLLMLLGTSWSDACEWEAEVRDFEKRCKSTVLRMKLDLPSDKHRTREVNDILNALCDTLLIKSYT